jgi:hypothetical protein
VSCQAVVTRLRYRAHQAFARFHASKHGVARLPPDLVDNSGTHDEELHILGGHTRIVSGRSSSTPSTSNATQSPASTGSPEGLYHRSSPKSSTQRGFTPETLEKAHPALLADLRSTKDTERVVSTQYASPITTFPPPSVAAGGYDPQAYPPKYALPQINTSSLPSRSAAAASARPRPSLDAWGGNVTQPVNQPSVGATGYVPAPSDTHSAFGMLGGDPDWDMQWHSFMDQLGMFTTDPNAPYSATQLKTDR